MSQRITARRTAAIKLNGLVALVLTMTLTLALGVHLANAAQPSGAFLLEWGSKGTADGQFDSPRTVAVKASGNVYVGDTINNRIQKFTPAGAFLTEWGSFGSSEGKFNNPRGLAADAFGNIFVSDRTNHRIQKFASGEAPLCRPSPA